MGYRRRRGARRSKLMARGRGGKYGRRLRLTRLGAPSVHKFKETFRTTDITIPANSNTSSVLSCTLNMLANSASLKALFDLYRITGVKWTFLYRYNSAEAGTANAGLPTLYTAINRDPFAPPPASIADILNDDSCKIHRADQLMGKGGRYIKSPKPDMSVGVTADGVPTGGLVTQQWNLGVGNNKQYWLCTGGNAQALDQSGVGHFGLRYLATNNDNAQSQVIEVYATLYFQMKEQD